jgi:hypothetical protein
MLNVTFAEDASAQACCVAIVGPAPVTLSAARYAPGQARSSTPEAEPWQRQWQLSDLRRVGLALAKAAGAGLLGYRGWSGKRKTHFARTEHNGLDDAAARRCRQIIGGSIRRSGRTDLGVTDMAVVASAAGNHDPRLMPWTAGIGCSDGCYRRERDSWA